MTFIPYQYLSDVSPKGSTNTLLARQPSKNSDLCGFEQKMNHQNTWQKCRPKKPVALKYFFVKWAVLIPLCH